MSVLAAQTRGKNKKSSSSSGQQAKSGTMSLTQRAQKAAAAMHKAHPSGKQTQAQLAAERANLQAARAALGKPSQAVAGTNVAQSTASNAVVNKAQRTAAQGLILGAQGVKGVMGSSLLHMHSSIPRRLSSRKPSAGVGRVHRPTGLNRRVPQRIGVTRKGWGQSRMHREKKVLASRHHRPPQVRTWKSGRRPR